MGTGRSKHKSFWQITRRNEKSRSLETQDDEEIGDSKSNDIPPNHELVEIDKSNQQPLNLNEKVDPVTVPCNSKDDFLQFFESNNINSEHLLIKFQFTHAIPELEALEQQNISRKFCENSLVLLMVTDNEEKWSIFWKSQKSGEFFELKQPRKLKWEANLRLCDFVANFLAKSLKNNHLGLISQFSFQTCSKTIDLDLLADSRDHNLLLLAAEHGDAKIVEILLLLKMNTCSMDNNVNAQSLAMKAKHYDVLHVLLENNSIFPNSFDATEIEGELKEFCDMTEKVHKLISSNERDKLEEILNQHPKLRHFYNFSNKSALMIALESKSFDVFDLLLSKKIRFGSYENPAEYYEQIDDYETKRRIRDIQNKYAQPFLEKHIHTLVANSTACFDETEVKDKHDKVKRAFELLSQNPFIKIILQIVAASKNFAIVFDFNREAVNIVDPTTSEFTQGIFYLSGKIFIGAKQLLDPGTEHETLAVLIHELCHFAMNLVYKNKANPYKNGDKKTMIEFEEISTTCEDASDNEDIISSVYDCYPEEAYHAELIVRVVHLLAFYQNLPEKLAEIRTTFIKLFEFYETKIVPELEQALPEIERRDEKERQIKDEKISKLKLISIIGGILAVLGIVTAIIVALFLYTPTYKFDELSVEERLSVIKAPIRYKGASLEFRDLFAQNSTVYGHLTSDHISQMLNEKSLDLADPHLHYLEEQISHVWENLTEKLKRKILNSTFTFQNESLKLNEINPKLFNFLTSDQIVEVLDGKELVVHVMIKNETKFHVDRKLKNSYIREIYFSFVEYVLGHQLDGCETFDGSTSNKSFETHYQEFVSQNISVQVDKIQKIQQTSEFKKCLDLYFDMYSHNSVHPLDFDKVLKLANDTKLFILSGEAGTGKTVTFEQFTMRIKKEFPTQWVSYIDLKEHKHLYKGVETLQGVENMLETIFGLSSKNEFEKEILKEYFKSGNLILLWNGFDEISPQFSVDVVVILGLVKNFTTNIQLVCTRPLYSNYLRTNFSAQVYNLIPFDQIEQEYFIRKFLNSENIEKSKIPKYLEKVQKIVISTGSNEGFDTPLMLGMIAELVANDVNIYDTENLYQIYQKFVTKKIEIWKEKGGFALKFLNNSITTYRNFDIMKLYQSFAIKMESQINSKLPLISTKLKIMRQENPSELTSDEISRMGILYINGFSNIKFAHRTFAEFFIAQYLIENVYIADDEPSKEEAELRILVLAVFAEKKEILNFLNSNIQVKTPADSKPFNRQISKLLATKYQKFLMFDLIKFENFSFPFYFFKRDPKVLKSMLQFDENETYYTSFFRYPKRKYESIQYDQLKGLIREILNEDEYDKFIRGKNQKGMILFSEYCYERSPNKYKDKNVAHDFYKLDDTLRLNDDPAYVFDTIANNLTKDEFTELMKSGLIFAELPNRNNADLIKIFLNFTSIQYTKSEQKEILQTVFTNVVYIEEVNSRFYPLMLKIGEIYSEIEIYNIYDTYIFPVMIYKGGTYFKTLWMLFVMKTSRDMQKMLLRKSSFCVIGLVCFPIGFLFNPLMQSWETGSFEDILKIYEAYFNVTEMQDIVLSHQSDVLLILIVSRADTRVYAEYMSKIFKGNEKALKEFFLREVEPTNLNAFELFNDFEDSRGNLKVYRDLFESLS